MVRYTFAVLATIGMLVGSLAAAPVPASAAAYDGTDPVATGCLGSARTVGSANLGGATLELRYSAGCRTTWARVTLQPSAPRCVRGDAYCGSALIVRNRDGRQFSCEIPTGGRSCYTRQVNDAGATSYAYGCWDDGIRFHCARTGNY